MIPSPRGYDVSQHPTIGLVVGGSRRLKALRFDCIPSQNHPRQQSVGPQGRSFEQGVEDAPRCSARLVGEMIPSPRGYDVSQHPTIGLVVGGSRRLKALRFDYQELMTKWPESESPASAVSGTPREIIRAGCGGCPYWTCSGRIKASKGPSFRLY
jgi:hypothetical protein